jgi:hypothetical protein
VLSYILPLRAADPQAELTEYLQWLAARADVVVVDGSDPTVFATHHRWWCEFVHHIRVDPARRTRMGKVGAVLTGLDHARALVAVVADDDVRWSATQLLEIERLLEGADVVRPQNVFTRRPWHAWWDTGCGPAQSSPSSTTCIASSSAL